MFKLLFKKKTKQTKQIVLSRLKWNENGIKSRFGETQIERANQIDSLFKSLKQKGEYVGRPPKYAVYIMNINNEIKTVYSNLVKECPVFESLEDDYNKINNYLDKNGYWGQECPLEVKNVLKGVSV